MQARRFFATVWRINSILILGAGSLAAVALAGAAATVLPHLARPEHSPRSESPDIVPPSAAPEAAAPAPQVPATLGAFESVPGTEGMLRAPLTTRDGYGAGSYSSGEGLRRVRNWLFLDPATGRTQWLLPSMDSLVLRTLALPEGSGDGGRTHGVARVLLHVIVPRDTDRSGRLSADDGLRLAVSAPDGQGLRTLVERADELSGARLIGPDRLLVFYRLGARLMSVEADLAGPAKPLVTRELLPSVPATVSAEPAA